MEALLRRLEALESELQHERSARLVLEARVKVLEEEAATRSSGVSESSPAPDARTAHSAPPQVAPASTSLVSPPTADTNAERAPALPLPAHEGEDLVSQAYDCLRAAPAPPASSDSLSAVSPALPAESAYESLPAAPLPPACDQAPSESAYGSLPPAPEENAYASLPVAIASSPAEHLLQESAYGSLPAAPVLSVSQPVSEEGTSSVGDDAYSSLPAAGVSCLSNTGIPEKAAPANDSEGGYGSLPASFSSSIAAPPLLRSLPPASSGYDPLPSSAAVTAATPAPLALAAPAPPAVATALPPAVRSAVQRQWDEDWQQALELPSHTSTARLNRTLKLHSISRDFIEAARALVITIIDDLLQPEPSKRKMKSIDVGGLAGGEKFAQDGIFLKFARDWHGIYGGDQYAMKAASLEIAGMRSYLKIAGECTESDLLSGVSLTVPLAVLFDYGGYRVLTTAVAPIKGRETLVYGSADAGKTVLNKDKRVSRAMLRAGFLLNVKEHLAGTTSDSKALLCGPTDIEVHLEQPKPEHQEGTEEGKRIVRKQKAYILDCARLFPPEAPSTTIAGFLVHATAPTATSGTSSISVVDLDRLRALAEIKELLSTMSLYGATSRLANRADDATVTRLELPGAGLYLRADANPHLPRSRSTLLRPRPLAADEGASLKAVFGFNPVATALLRSLSRLAGSAASTLSGHGSDDDAFVIFGDAIVVTGERGQHLYHTLREETVMRFPSPLSSDAFTRFGLDNAAEHNTEVHQATSRLLSRLLPALVSRLALRKALVVGQKDLVDALHSEGLNVRHLGILRVLIDSANGNVATDKNAYSPFRGVVGACENISRLRSLILSSMITRVLKQLLREAMRTLADVAGAGGGQVAVAGTGGPDGATSEDPRVRLLRKSLNRVLAPRGGWSEEAQKATGRGASTANRRTPAEIEEESRHPNTLLWGPIIKTHTALKFSSVSPALSSKESKPDFDLRFGLSPFMLASSVVAQTGVLLRSTALLRLTALASPVYWQQAFLKHQEGRRVGAISGPAPYTAAVASSLSVSADPSDQGSDGSSDLPRVISGCDLLPHPHDPFLMPQQRIPDMVALGADFIAPPSAYRSTSATATRPRVAEPVDWVPGSGRNGEGNWKPRSISRLAQSAIRRIAGDEAAAAAAALSAPSDDENVIVIRSSAPLVMSNNSKSNSLYLETVSAASARYQPQSARASHSRRDRINPFVAFPDAENAARVIDDVWNGAAEEDDEVTLARTFGVNYSYTASLLGVGPVDGSHSEDYRFGQESVISSYYYSTFRAFYRSGKRWRGRDRLLLRFPRELLSSAGSLLPPAPLPPTLPTMIRVFSETDAAVSKPAGNTADTRGKAGISDKDDESDRPMILEGDIEGLGCRSKPLLPHQAVVAAIAAHPCVSGVRVAIDRARLVCNSIQPAFDPSYSSPNVTFTNFVAGALIVDDGKNDPAALATPEAVDERLSKVKLFPADTATLYGIEDSTSFAVANVSLVVGGGHSGRVSQATLQASEGDKGHLGAAIASVRTPEFVAALQGAYTPFTSRGFVATAIDRGNTGIDGQAISPHPRITCFHLVLHPGTWVEGLVFGITAFPLAFSSGTGARIPEGSWCFKWTNSGPNGTWRMTADRQYDSEASQALAKRGFSNEEAKTFLARGSSAWREHKQSYKTTGQAEALDHKNSLPDVLSFIADTAAGTVMLFLNGNDTGAFFEGIPFSSFSQDASTEEAGGASSNSRGPQRNETASAVASDPLVESLRPFVCMPSAGGRVSRVSFVFECGPRSFDRSSLEKKARAREHDLLSSSATESASTAVVEPSQLLPSAPPVAGASSGYEDPALSYSSLPSSSLSTAALTAPVERSAHLVASPQLASHSITVTSCLRLLSDGISGDDAALLQLCDDRDDPPVEPIEPGAAVPLLCPPFFVPASFRENNDLPNLPDLIVRRLNALWLTEQAFKGGEESGKRLVLEAHVALAEAAVKLGFIRAAVDTILRAFALPEGSATASSQLWPQHCVAQGYVVLGDACLLEENFTSDAFQRWANAEKWYARALNTLLIHVPSPHTRRSVLAILKASSSRTDPFHNASTEPLDDRLELGSGEGKEDSPALHLHPFGLVVLDRLIGVLRAQGRAHHSVPLCDLFLGLAALYPCPIGALETQPHDHLPLPFVLRSAGYGHAGTDLLGLLADKAGTDRSTHYHFFDDEGQGQGEEHRLLESNYHKGKNTGSSFSPWARVLGHCIPHAVRRPSSRGAASPSSDVVKIIHDILDGPQPNAGLALGGGAPHRSIATFSAVQGWLRAVGRMSDSGSYLDVPAPVGLGAFSFGPLPAAYRSIMSSPPASAPVATGALSSVLGPSAASADTSLPVRPFALLPPEPALAAPGNSFQWGPMLSARDQVLLPLSAAGPASGAGSGESVSSATKTQQQQHGGEVERIIDIGKSSIHAVAVTSFGRVFSYLCTNPGSHNTAAKLRDIGLGDGEEKLESWRPYLLRTLSGRFITSVVCGGSGNRAFTLLLDSQGVVFTFGSGDAGCLGHNDKSSRSTPRAIRALDGIPIAHLAAGESHVLAAPSPAAIKSGAANASLYAWGKNEKGSCGLGHDSETLLPMPVTGIFARPSLMEEGAALKLGVVVAMSCSSNSSAVITEDGLLFRWGEFVFGRNLLGKLFEPLLVVPQLDPLYPPVDPFCSPASSAAPAVADFTLQAAAGEFLPKKPSLGGLPLGLGFSLSMAQTQCAPDLSVRFISVAVNRSSLFAVSDDGRLFSMGRQDFGATGHGLVKRDPPLSLVRVPGIGPVRSSGPSLENAVMDNESRVLSVWPDEGSVGAFVLVARQRQPYHGPSSSPSSPYIFSLMGMGSFSSSTHITPQMFEAAERASKTSAAPSPVACWELTYLPAFGDVPAGVCKVLGPCNSSGNGMDHASLLTGLAPRLHEVLTQKMLPLEPTAAVAAASGSADAAPLTILRIKTGPGPLPPVSSSSSSSSSPRSVAMVFPGQALVVSYRVPHNARQDVIAVRSARVVTNRRGARKVVPAVEEPITIISGCLGPSGEVALSAPSSPGLFILSHFFGVQKMNGSSTLLASWAGRIDVPFVVLPRVRVTTPAPERPWRLADNADPFFYPVHVRPLQRYLSSSTGLVELQFFSLVSSASMAPSAADSTGTTSSAAAPPSTQVKSKGKVIAVAGGASSSSSSSSAFSFFSVPLHDEDIIVLMPVDGCGRDPAEPSKKDGVAPDTGASFTLTSPRPTPGSDNWFGGSGWRRSAFGPHSDDYLRRPRSFRLKDLLQHDAAVVLPPSATDVRGPCSYRVTDTLTAVKTATVVVMLNELGRNLACGRYHVAYLSPSQPALVHSNYRQTPYAFQLLSAPPVLQDNGSNIFIRAQAELRQRGSGINTVKAGDSTGVSLLYRNAVLPDHTGSRPGHDPHKPRRCPHQGAVLDAEAAAHEPQDDWSDMPAPPAAAGCTVAVPMPACCWDETEFIGWLPQRIYDSLKTQAETDAAKGAGKAFALMAGAPLDNVDGQVDRHSTTHVFSPAVAACGFLAVPKDKIECLTPLNELLRTARRVSGAAPPSALLTTEERLAVSMTAPPSQGSFYLALFTKARATRPQLLGPVPDWRKLFLGAGTADDEAGDSGGEEEEEEEEEEDEPCRLTLVALSDSWSIAAPPAPAMALSSSPHASSSGSGGGSSSVVVSGSGSTVVIGSGVTVGAGVVIGGASASASSSASSTSNAPRHPTTGQPLWADDPELDDLDLYLPDGHGAMKPIAMATDGPVHAKLLQRATLMYRALYAKSGVPESMVDGIMASVLSNIASSPVVALTSIIDSLKSQI